jgi:hypothetical protein
MHIFVNLLFDILFVKKGLIHHNNIFHKVKMLFLIAIFKEIERI